MVRDFIRQGAQGTADFVRRHARRVGVAVVALALVVVGGVALAGVPEASDSPASVTATVTSYCDRAVVTVTNSGGAWVTGLVGTLPEIQWLSNGRLGPRQKQTFVVRHPAHNAPIEVRSSAGLIAAARYVFPQNGADAEGKCTDTKKVDGGYLHARYTNVCDGIVVSVLNTTTKPQKLVIDAVTVRNVVADKQTKVGEIEVLAGETKGTKVGRLHSGDPLNDLRLEVKRKGDAIGYYDESESNRDMDACAKGEKTGVAAETYDVCTSGSTMVRVANRSRTDRAEVYVSADGQVPPRAVTYETDEYVYLTNRVGGTVVVTARVVDDERLAHIVGSRTMREGCPAPPGDASVKPAAADPSQAPPGGKTEPAPANTEPPAANTAAAGATRSATRAAAIAKGVCGSSYGVVGTPMPLDYAGKPLGLVFLLYSKSTGKNCAVTVKTTNLKQRAFASVYLRSSAQAKDGQKRPDVAETAIDGHVYDEGDYFSYAGGKVSPGGPVWLDARGKCVQWGGTASAEAKGGKDGVPLAQAHSDWGHCGG